jgi:hypothetical protein
MTGGMALVLYAGWQTLGAVGDVERGRTIAWAVTSAEAAHSTHSAVRIADFRVLGDDYVTSNV